ncbi:MAG: flagellar biosynthesis protein FlhB [Gemmataceae bacterium]|nr:flagellar biosynthesis protein FlhB [Gemmataceae bacterium]
MAEDFQDRTEPASPKRREDAAEKGQAAFSQDLVGSAVLLAGIVGLWMFGPAIARDFVALVRGQFRQRAPDDLGVGQAQELLGAQAARLLWIGLPVLVLPLAAGVLASLVQTGFRLSLSRLSPDLERLSPTSGLGRMLSWSGAVKGLLGLAKVALLVVLAWIVLRSRAGVFGSLGQGDLGTGAGLAWQVVLRLGLWLASAFLVLGFADYAWQRWKLEQSLLMTRQEAKDEAKETEGDPLVKNRMRKRQREMARQRMLDEVPQATVVVTNPTHYAVALRYDGGSMKAPKVVAKGAGDLALRLAARARLHGVPVVERPPVARALFRSAGLGQEIPQELFVAVAELIAFVYRLRGR